MFKHLTAITLFVATSLSLSSQASASLILDTYTSGSATPTTIGGYVMTDFCHHQWHGRQHNEYYVTHQWLPELS